jgi:hypothetical protein
MEEVRTSETSVKFNVTTRRYIPDASKLRTRRRENLKSHMFEKQINIFIHLSTSLADASFVYLVFMNPTLQAAVR